MQLNTLNRVIALFLIGGFVIALAALSLEQDIIVFLEPYSKMGLGPSAGVFLAVALLSTTALAGSIVDAIGNLTVRRLIRRQLGRRRSLARLFFCAEEFDEQDQWQKTFKSALENDLQHRALAQETKEMIKDLSAGLFFRTAEKEQAEWLIQHHSMYHLSANFVVILIIGTIWSLLSKRCYLAAGSIVSAYLLTTFALDNYLYTYHLSLRNAYLALQDSRDLPAPSVTG